MQFGSLCSGIEGAAVAFADLPWCHAYCAEIQPFCCDLLAHHYPGVPNLGDITATPAIPSVNLIVSGTPCQSFSRAGKREGLADPRGRLALRFVEIRQSQPEWIILRLDDRLAVPSAVKHLMMGSYARKVRDATAGSVASRSFVRRHVFRSVVDLRQSLRCSGAGDEL